MDGLIKQRLPKVEALFGELERRPTSVSALSKELKRRSKEPTK